MSWIVASLLSAAFLGLYDLCIKHSVRDNAVLPVLFFANLCSATVWLTLMALSAARPEWMSPALAVPSLGVTQHLQILLKSTIVAASWISAYFAVKHLPVSIAAPVRATGPLFTLAFALVLLRERPSAWEWLGIAVTLGSFFALSLAGRREGIHFHRDKWIGWLLLGTVLNGLSGFYDKYLLGHAGFTASTVQAWFSIYLALLFFPFVLGWKLRWWPRKVFHWRWTIVGMSATLLIADFIYFDALRNPDALVSIVSSLRRGSTLIAFAGAVWLFKEPHGRQKLPAVIGIILGIVLTIVG